MLAISSSSLSSRGPCLLFFKAPFCTAQVAPGSLTRRNLLESNRAPDWLAQEVNSKFDVEATLAKLSLGEGEMSLPCCREREKICDSCFWSCDPIRLNLSFPRGFQLGYLSIC